MKPELKRSPGGAFYMVDRTSGLRWKLVGDAQGWCLINWNLEQLSRKFHGRKLLPEDRWV